MTPAERLLAAADLLDKRAAEATQGLWAREILHERWEGDRPAYWVRFDEAHDDGGETSGTVAECPWGDRDATYIATMHPEVGKLLAIWLRRLGEDARWLTGTDREFGLGIADLLLAGAS